MPMSSLAWPRRSSGSRPGPRLPPSVAAAGVVLQLTGIGIRAWSMRTLGRAYTRTLRTEGGQPVIDDGPYRLVRHPGYLGSLLIWGRLRPHVAEPPGRDRGGRRRG